MAVDDSLILKLEKLSKLRLESDERESIKRDLEKMILMIDKISEVNTDGVAPLIYMHDEMNVLREDDVKGMLSRDNALKNGPKTTDKYFAVPKVINR